MGPPRRESRGLYRPPRRPVLSGPAPGPGAAWRGVGFPLVRPLVFTVVPLLALGATLAWAGLHMHRVEERGEPQLYRRAVEWERRLTGGPRSAAVELVHPAVRRDPR